MQPLILTKMLQTFSDQAQREGQECCAKGNVLQLKISDGLLKARVRENNAIFDVYMDLRPASLAYARCTCQKASLCKHGAACLFFLYRKNEIPVAKAASLEPEKIQEKDFTWYTKVTPKEEGLYTYQFGIHWQKEPLDIIPMIIEIFSKYSIRALDGLSEDHLFQIPLPSKVLVLPWKSIRPLVHFLLHYPFLSKEPLEVTTSQLLLLQEIEEEQQSSRFFPKANIEWPLAVYQLQKKAKIETPALPLTLQAKLRDYQIEGLAWLQFLRIHRVGGILADDMGLGKTLQTLAHLLLEKEEGRLQTSLLFAPTSLIGNWFTEIKRFAPTLKAKIFHGVGRHQESFQEYDLVITTYGLLQKDQAILLHYPFYYLILDEAQLIKNARAKTTQLLLQIKATHKLCLSGTPLENHLGELWSLFHFLMPGYLGNATFFRKFFTTPIEKHQDKERQDLLIRRVKPFLLRRNKAQVAKELPEKTEITQWIPLEGEQRELYEWIRAAMEKKVREAITKQGMDKSRILVLDALLRLRQVCCDPRLLSATLTTPIPKQSAKLDALMVLLTNLLAEGRRVLVFSQFTSMLSLIEEKLQIAEFPYLLLTGKSKNRSALVQQFQEGKVPLFLISLKAGGIGLNLTKADTVIHYDPWWNPAVEQQATDRSHRIGQISPVFVYKLITQGTIEESILALQKKKQGLIENILNMEAATLGLSDTVLDQLLMPLFDMP